MNRIVLPAWVANAFGDEIAAIADGRAELIPVPPLEPTPPEVAAADILLHAFWYQPPTLTDVVSKMTAVNWVHSLGAGVDDLVAAGVPERVGIVTNSAGAYAPAIAEYVVAMMVLVSRDADAWFTAQRERVWLQHRGRGGTALHGKTVGIVGYGGVGRQIACACKSLGMTCWATKRTPTVSTSEPLDRLLSAQELPDLLRASDYVVLTASLNASTRSLIGARELEMMKPEATLVNIARGALVDQEALAAALQRGALTGAVLDVTTPEPLPPENPLWGAPNVWISPHVSGVTEDSWIRASDLFCQNLRLYLDARPEALGNLVNFHAHR